MRSPAGSGHELDDELGVVAAVSDKVTVGSQAGDELGNRFVIGGLASAEGDAKRQAALIDNRVDLGT